MCYLRDLGAPAMDAEAWHQVAPLGEGTFEELVDTVLAYLGWDVADDTRVRAATLEQARDLTAHPTGPYVELTWAW